MFLYQAVEGSSLEVRKGTYTVIETLANMHPELTNHMVRDAVTAFISRGKPSSPSAKPTESTEDASEKPWNKESRLSAFVMSAVSFGAQPHIELALREELIAELVIVGHHQLLCPSCFILACFIPLLNSERIQAGHQGRLGLI